VGRKALFKRRSDILSNSCLLIIKFVVDFGERHFADVREAFSHEQKFSDGVIFRNIRENYYKQDEISEKKWWARLTETKRRDLRQLLNSGPLINAFDELLTYPGLWQPIQLGTLHRLHSLRCQEVLNSRAKRPMLISCRS
jgi:hypothetical protein